jgi:hypothetical protein
VFAVTESKLDSARDSVTQFKVNNYNSIRLDRQCKTKKCGGGIIVYVHNSHMRAVFNHTGDCEGHYLFNL